MLARRPSAPRRSHATRACPALFLCFVCFVVPFLLGAAEPAPKLHRGPVQPHWLGNSARFWYRNDLPGGAVEFVLVDAARGSREIAFDATRAAAALTAVAAPAPSLAAVTGLEFTATPRAATPRAVTLRTATQAWTLDLDTYTAVVAAPKTPPADPADPAERPAAAKSPDGKWEAFTRDDNLWLRDLATKHERPLTHDGSAGHTFRRDASRARLVSMQYDLADYPPHEADVRWSPDSKRLVALQTNIVPERRVTLVESSPAGQLQPRTSSYPYLKPGDEIPVSRPRLFDAAEARELPVDLSGMEHAWSFDPIRWAADSSCFTFFYNRRGHQLTRLAAVDAATGAVRIVAEEKSDTFVHYSRSGRYTEHLDATDEVIAASERDGWLHLYLFDRLKGGVKHRLTQGEFVVRGIEHLDRRARVLWVRVAGAGGLDDPYYEQLARVHLDGSGFKILTPEPGMHSFRWSPDKKFVVDTWSRVDAPPVSVLRRADDGTIVCELERADAAALLAHRGRWPERFVAKGRDGTTDIHGIIMRPRDFDPAKKYPVIERIYAGPHGYFTPKAFGAHDALVERGFIVVQLDGMGTAGRSKAFHDVAWRNVADAGFPDRIAWLKAAAAKYPELDLARLGIYGTSAGGQSALGALLFHGDFYRAAGADCGCHDNRMDKIWWNEQWLGWPVGPHYAANSNVTHAAKLRGKLLLAVGELDRNVDPASTYQVADALIKADKDFDYLVMPGGGHGIFRTPYGRRRLEDFFVRAFLPSVP